MSEHKFWVTPGSQGDMENEWLTPEQIEEKQKRYQEWLATATEEDKKPFQITMNIQENPAFDAPKESKPLESHKFMIIDVGHAGYRVGFNPDSKPLMPKDPNKTLLLSKDIQDRPGIDGQSFRIVLTNNWATNNDLLRISFWQRIRKFFGLSYRYETRK